MDRVLSDLQPGLGTTAITGELTLTKTGTTARTATFPDAAITVAGLNLAQTWTATQSFAALSATGQITSTVATGTAPLVIASTTAVANLNASLLLGQTWANPGAIGGTTPAAISCTTLTASGDITTAANLYVGYLSGVDSRWTFDGAGSYVGTWSNHALKFLTNGSIRLTIAAADGAATFTGGISCTTVTPSGAISQTGGQYHYLRGDASTDGSVRMSSQAAETLTIERRTGGSWVVMGSFA